MRVKAVCLLLLVSVLGWGCGRPSHIVFMDKEIEQYIAAAQEAGPKELDGLYQRCVLQPFFSKAQITGSDHYQPISNLDGLQEIIDILKSENVVGIVKGALKRCAKFLPTDTPTVYILPANPDDSLLEYGFSCVKAFSLADIISLEVNPFVDGWKEKLLTTVAHEYHHIAWRHHRDRCEMTLLETMLMEGRAEMFAQMVYPEIDLELPSQQIRWDYMDAVRGNLDCTDPFFLNQVMVQWYFVGYTIGYRIMEAFVANNPETTIECWTTMTAEQILEKSGYDWKSD